MELALLLCPRILCSRVAVVYSWFPMRPFLTIVLYQDSIQAMTGTLAFGVSLLVRDQAGPSGNSINWRCLQQHCI